MILDDPRYAALLAADAAFWPPATTTVKTPCNRPRIASGVACAAADGKGAEVVQQLREAKQSGQPLETAIQKAGGKAEKIPPFSLIEEEKPKSQDKEPKKNEPADLPAIKQAVAFLNSGEISDFFPTGENGFIAVLEKRERLADANASEKKAAFEKRVLDGKRQVVLMEWLRDRGQAAGLQFTKG